MTSTQISLEELTTQSCQNNKGQNNRNYNISSFQNKSTKEIGTMKMSDTFQNKCIYKKFITDVLVHTEPAAVSMFSSCSTGVPHLSIDGLESIIYQLIISKDLPKTSSVL